MIDEFLLIWTVPGTILKLDPDSWEYETHRAIEANRAARRLFKGEIDVETYLDTIESLDTDMDEYIEDFEDECEAAEERGLIIVEYA